MLLAFVALIASFVVLLPNCNAQTNFTNPVVYSDFADNDVFKGPDGAYYFSASSFQFSPGGPILKSFDLVNWEFIGHSVPVLDFGASYDMSGTPAWVQGIWASTMRYRASNKTWYWIGCIGFWNTYIYTAPDVTGPWKQAAVLPGGTCYYDCGLLIDDDDTMYVAYGNTNVNIAQLASDGLGQVKTQQIFSGPTNLQGVEGNRLYKINGTYYILDDSPQGVTLIWRATNIWGPWENQTLQTNVGSPLPGGGLIDQGSLVEGPSGQWYFMSCSWDYPSGRIPLIAPIEWSDEGWPSLVEINGAWGSSYQYPATPQVLTNWTGTDEFSGTALSPQWEWNFNPDTTKYTFSSGNVTLYTATVTNDLYSARNVLTHRTYGPNPVGTAELDFSNMADGDRAGLAAFRDQSAWIEVIRSGTNFAVRMIYNATQGPNNSWTTVSNGTVAANTDLPSGTSKIWLRTQMNVML
ncbi:glycoside hydrolase family 43 protein [Viridothelium virens]|uniref:Glycoside hydrolase family 43 protein n=1 Tax=Viridothelium virens TaxID=1048519 RepID=A0A6A6HDX6_VIRVR|nr:glycoside hydrolase family 43 protein [Viridothelium virens]